MDEVEDKRARFDYANLAFLCVSGMILHLVR